MSKLEPAYELLYKFAHAEPNKTPYGKTETHNFIPIEEFAKTTTNQDLYYYMRLVKCTFADKFDMEPYGKEGIFIRRIIPCQF